MTKILLLVLEIFLGTLHDYRNQPHGNRKYQQRNQRHKRADAQHHHKHADNRRHGSNELRRTLVQTLAQRIHIIGNPRQDLPMGLPVEIVHRKTVNLLRNLLAHPIGQFLGNTGHNITLDK